LPSSFVNTHNQCIKYSKAWSFHSNRLAKSKRVLVIQPFCPALLRFATNLENRTQLASPCMQKGKHAYHNM